MKVSEIQKKFNVSYCKAVDIKKVLDRDDTILIELADIPDKTDKEQCCQCGWDKDSPHCKEACAWDSIGKTDKGECETKHHWYKPSKTGHSRKEEE